MHLVTIKVKDAETLSANAVPSGDMEDGKCCLEKSIS